MDFMFIISESGGKGYLICNGKKKGTRFYSAQPNDASVHHFQKCVGEWISYLQQQQKKGPNFTRHNLTMHPIPMICA